MSPECDECGNDLNVGSVKRPNVDWIKVVCSECGGISEVSMIRLASEVSQ